MAFAATSLLFWQILFLAGILGIIAQASPWGGGCGLLFLALFSGRKLKSARAWAGLAVCFLLGAALGWLSRPAPLVEHPAWTLSGDKTTISGRVRSVDSAYERRIRIILDQVRTTNGQGLDSGLVLTWESPLFLPLPGDVLQAELRVKPTHSMLNPGVWDVEEYWANRDVRYRAYAKHDRNNLLRLDAGRNPFWSGRDLLRKKVAALLRPDQSQGRGVLMALLFGEKFFIQNRTADLMSRAGLIHSLALSGLHVGFMAGLGWLLALGLGRVFPRTYLRIPRPKLAVLLAAPLVLAYVVLGRASPTLVRAGLMFGFWGALLLMGRSRILLDGLFLALAVIILASPRAVFDLRLQLSAAAVAGIALYLDLKRSPRFNSGSGKRPSGKGPGGLLRTGISSLSRGLFQTIMVSFAAQAALLPLLCWNFGQASPFFALNGLWLPILGTVVMPLGLGGLCLAGLGFIPPAQNAAAWCFTQAAAVIDLLLLGLEKLESAGLLPVFVCPRPEWPAWIGYWALLLSLFLLLRNRGWTIPQKTALALGAVLLILPMAASSIESRESVRLSLLDLGQGQGLTIKSPDNGLTLVDGGGFFSKTFDLGRMVVSPALTLNRFPGLDRIILTHPDLDHLRGLFFPLSWFPVDGFYSNGRPPKSEFDKQRLESSLARSGLNPLTLRAGDDLSLGSGLILQTLHPAPDYHSRSSNNLSLAFRLVWRGRPLALLPADMEGDALKALLASKRELSAPVLILPHHGSTTGLHPGLFDRVKPRLALCSAGYMNQWDLPSPHTRELLKKKKTPLLVTADEGCIELEWKSPAAPPVVRTARSGRIEIE